MVALENQIGSKTKTDREIAPGSIIHKAEPANSFLGPMSDDTPITAIATTDLNSDRRSAVVELVGKGWQEIGATDVQLMSIRKLFRGLLFNAPHINTMGRLREAGRKRELAKIQGVGDIGQFFLIVGTKKHLQVSRLSSGVRSNVVSSPHA
jgi:hypothetical protein